MRVRAYLGRHVWARPGRLRVSRSGLGKKERAERYNDGDYHVRESGR